MDKISPKYQMKIVQNINDKLYELFKSYDDVEAYIEKWREVYDDFGNAKLLQKSEMRKDIVIELSYKGFG